MDVPSTRRIVLLGKTGAGKSSLANTIFGETVFKMSHLPISQTSTCQAESRLFKGKNITLIDTPGFLDTDKSEEDMKPEILKCILESAPGPHAFVLVLKVEKFTDHEKDVISKMSQYFSEEALRYTVILFTHGDQLPEDMNIQEFVSQSKDLLGLVKKCGGRCHVIDNKYWNSESQNEYRNNHFQVGELLNTIDKIVIDNKSGYYTNELLQAVETEIQKEEKRIRQAGNVCQEDIRKKAKTAVYKKNIGKFLQTAGKAMIKGALVCGTLLLGPEVAIAAGAVTFVNTIRRERRKSRAITEQTLKKETATKKPAGKGNGKGAGAAQTSTPGGRAPTSKVKGAKVVSVLKAILKLDGADGTEAAEEEESEETDTSYAAVDGVAEAAAAEEESEGTDTSHAAVDGVAEAAAAEEESEGTDTSHAAVDGVAEAAAAEEESAETDTSYAAVDGVAEAAAAEEESEGTDTSHAAVDGVAEAAAAEEESEGTDTSHAAVDGVAEAAAEGESAGTDTSLSAVDGVSETAAEGASAVSALVKVSGTILLGPEVNTIRHEARKGRAETEQTLKKETATKKPAGKGNGKGAGAAQTSTPGGRAPTSEVKGAKVVSVLKAILKLDGADGTEAAEEEESEETDTSYAAVDGVAEAAAEGESAETDTSHAAVDAVAEAAAAEEESAGTDTSDAAVDGVAEAAAAEEESAGTDTSHAAVDGVAEAAAEEESAGTDTSDAAVDGVAEAAAEGASAVSASVKVSGTILLGPEVNTIRHEARKGRAETEQTLKKETATKKPAGKGNGKGAGAAQTSTPGGRAPTSEVKGAKVGSVLKAILKLDGADGTEVNTIRHEARKGRAETEQTLKKETATKNPAGKGNGKGAGAAQTSTPGGRAPTSEVKGAKVGSVLKAILKLDGADGTEVNTIRHEARKGRAETEQTLKKETATKKPAGKGNGKGAGAAQTSTPGGRAPTSEVKGAKVVSVLKAILKLDGADGTEAAEEEESAETDTSHAAVDGVSEAAAEGESAETDTSHATVDGVSEAAAEGESAETDTSLAAVDGVAEAAAAEGVSAGTATPLAAVDGVTEAAAEGESAETDTSHAAVDGVSEAATEGVSAGTDTPLAAVDGVTEAAAEGASAVSASVKEAVDGVAEAAAEGASAVSATVKEAVDGVAEAAAEGASVVSATVKEAVDGVAEAAAEGASTVVTAAVEGIAETQEQAIAVIEGLVEGREAVAAVMEEALAVAVNVATELCCIQ